MIELFIDSDIESNKNNNNSDYLNEDELKMILIQMEKILI